MDFISRKPLASSDPLASRPASRPAIKPKPPVKPAPSVASQIPSKATSAPAAKPATKNPDNPATKPTPKPPVPHPDRTPRIETTAQTTTPQSKPVDALALKASAALSGTSQPASQVPDNNTYSLGGKSPFLENYTINKRPLSDSVPAKKQDNFEKLSFLGVNDGDSSHRKNVYPKSSARSIDQPAEPTKAKVKTKTKTVKVIDDTTKKSGVPTWLVIIITIILGAAVGAGVYFLLPK